MKKVLSISVVLNLLLCAVTAMAVDKVVVIPLGGSIAPKTDKLYGKGRPGTFLLAHTDPNGYCTTSDGTKFALSNHWATWANADAVCPSGTWVCSVADLSTAGACPIVPITTSPNFNCNGTGVGSAVQSSLHGWLADAEPRHYLGMYRSSAWSSFNSNIDTCYYFRAWCCWK